MKKLEDNSVDAIVTDPPYGWSFMGKKWDYDIPSVEVWKEALRVLKPGGHALVACGTRTQHRMAVNLEDAGFEIRDLIAWVYGSGFPKSLNIGNEMKEWEGWGTALKPAMELWTLCRKPLSEKTVVENVLKWGTGGINIDGCRVGTEGITTNGKGKQDGNTPIVPQSPDFVGETHIGRFPANFIHDGSEEVVSLFPDSKSTGGRIGNKGSALNMMGTRYEAGDPGYGDSGSASRFFYCAKASKGERNMGLDNMEKKAITDAKGNGLGRVCNICGASQLKPCDCKNNTWVLPKKNQNNHPTVKPLALMRYLCRLITPPGGTVLDPYMGSGTTGMACKEEGFNFIGIEIEPEYVKIAEARIKAIPERMF
jgi:site-specific DNA-methyltransferase (adenine-specific)